MSRIDIGSSVSPEKLSGNTRGFAGAGVVGRPAFVFGLAGVGSFEALSKIAPRSLALGEESIPVSTIACDRAGVAENMAAPKTIAVRMRGFMLTGLFCGRPRVTASAPFRDLPEAERSPEQLGNQNKLVDGRVVAAHPAAGALTIVIANNLAISTSPTVAGERFSATFPSLLSISRGVMQQDNPPQQQTNPTSLTLKLVTGDTHTVHPPDYETVINAVGDTTVSMIAFHDAARRVYIPCRAIVSIVESVPSETQAASTWNIDLR